MPARARGPRRPRAKPSSASVTAARVSTAGATVAVRTLPCLLEGVAGARDDVAHRGNCFARLAAVVAGGLFEILRIRRRLVCPLDVLAVQDLVVVAAVDPALQLTRANGREGVGTEHRVDELPDF